MMQSFQAAYKYWCHLCKKEFDLAIEPLNQVICCFCFGEFCEVIETQNDPRSFIPFGQEQQQQQQHIRQQAPTTIIQITSIRNTIPIARNIFDNLLATMFPNTHFQQGQSMEQLIEYIGRNDANRYGTPPASKTVVDGLKQITCPPQPCSVCQDDFDKEVLAVELPCFHHFHKDCIIPWLTLHNSCPVCRNELPTDDPDYEQKKMIQ